MYRPQNARWLGTCSQYTSWPRRTIANILMPVSLFTIAIFLKHYDILLHTAAEFVGLDPTIFLKALEMLAHEGKVCEVRVKEFLFLLLLSFAGGDYRRRCCQILSCLRKLRECSVQCAMCSMLCTVAGEYFISNHQKFGIRTTDDSPCP